MMKIMGPPTADLHTWHISARIFNVRRPRRPAERAGFVCRDPGCRTLLLPYTPGSGVASCWRIVVVAQEPVDLFDADGIQAVRIQHAPRHFGTGQTGDIANFRIFVESIFTLILATAEQ